MFYPDLSQKPIWSTELDTTDPKTTRHHRHRPTQVRLNSARFEAGLLNRLVCPRRRELFCST